MKLKRFLTGVLSAVMALSVCALPAAAADGDASTTATKYTTSTINKSKKGSITIYKRAELTDPTDRPKSTGEEIQSPSGDPLENAGFTVYKVLNADKLVEYYNGLPTETVKEITVASCFNDGTAATAYTKENLKPEIANAAVKDSNNKTELFTNDQGVVKFDNLKVGLYLVMETTLPQAVTKKTEPFLISVPMTRIGATEDETENENQKVWMYDVTVYPKNSIAQGDVILEKKGVVGSKVTDAVSLQYVKFTLYKKNDNNNDYTPVAGCTDVSTDSSGQIKFENLTKGSYYVMETGYESGHDNVGYILDTKTKYAFDVDDKGNAVASTDTNLTGDNVVKKTTTGIFEISAETAAQVNLTVYDYKPDVEKTVTKRDGSSTVTNTDGTTVGNHEADYSVGDKVPYTLTIKVPENVAKLHTFKVVDTTLKDQLKHIEEGFTLTATDKASNAQTLTEKAAYTKKITEDTDTNTSILTVDFTTTALASVAGGTITIKYYATLGAGAVVADKGNLNTAKLLYSRTTDTTKAEEGDNKPYEIEDQSVVYTFSTSLLKKGEGGTYGDKAMKGVAFELYKKIETDEWGTDGTVVIAGKPYAKSSAVVKNAVELGLATDANETWILIPHPDALNAGRGDDAGTTDADGKLTYTGLPKGTYRFVETKTLDGYNLLSKPVDAKLNQQYTTKWTTSTTYVGGKLEKNKYSETTYTGDEASTTDNPITIINRSGFQLPVTGGFGTLLFSGIGVLLVLAGVAVLFSMKKKNDRA